MNTIELQQSDSAHYLHPFTDAKALSRNGARVIIRAEGQYRYIWGPEPSYPKDQPRSGPVEGGLTGKLPVGFETYR